MTPHSEGALRATVLLMGDSGVGKTSLLRRVQNEDPGEALQTRPTVGIDFVALEYVRLDAEQARSVPVRVTMYDPMGAETFAPIFSSYYRNIHAAIAIYDLTDKRSFQHLRSRWLADLRRYAPHGDDVPVLLLGNKRDLLAKVPRATTPEQVRQLAEEFGIPPTDEFLVEVSAKDWTYASEHAESPIDAFVARHVLSRAREPPLRPAGASTVPLVVRDTGNPLLQPREDMSCSPCTKS